jgi:hypothetical protein
MANYLILIYGDEQRWESMSQQEQRQIDQGHAAFRATVGTAVLASGQLELSDTATTLRGIDDDAPVITDGPYAEAKEGIGGFYLVEATDLDQVIGWSALLAEVCHDHSAVEIRPLVDHGVQPG